MSRGKALGRGMAKAAKMARYWFETPGRITPIKLRNVPWLRYSPLFTEEPC